MVNTKIAAFEEGQKKKNIPEFDVGDTVSVVTRISEGEKERLQAFQGTVIACKGSGLSQTFSLYRVSYGEGIERVFYIHSPRIAEIQIIKRGDVRKSKLYYLRGEKGKAAKVEEKIEASSVVKEEVPVNEKPSSPKKEP